MPATTTMRVSVGDRDTAQELAKERGRSQMEIVHEALELYQRHHMLAAMNRGFAALRRNEAVWKEEMAEREAWDITLGDATEND